MFRLAEQICNYRDSNKYLLSPVSCEMYCVKFVMTFMMRKVLDRLIDDAVCISESAV